MSSSVSDLAPQAKKILVFRNGDPFHNGRRLVVNQRQFLTFEAFLTEVTSTVQASVAVRKLYTPRHGHRVTELEELQNGNQYVAAGFEKFKGLDYLHTGVKQTSGNRSKDSAQGGMAPAQKMITSARWRKHIQMPCIIHVFRNGDLMSPPFRILLAKRTLLEWDLVLGLLTEKAFLRNGAVRKLCTLDGVPISSGDELTHGEYYVAVGAERYKSLPYMELLVPKNSPHGTLRNHPGNRRRIQKDGLSKPYSVSQDGASDSALISPIEQPESRRVQSTGDADTQIQVSPPPVRRQPRKNQSTEEQSVFYAKPVRVRPHHKISGNQQEAENQETGRVFKVKESRREIAGAPEVVEDEHTRVEIPLDQRAAETVEEEVTPRRKATAHKQQRAPETVEDEVTPRKKAAAHKQTPREPKQDKPRESRPRPPGPSKDPKATRAGEKTGPRETKAKGGKRRASKDIEDEDDQRASHDVEDDQRASHDVEDDQRASHDVEDDQRASHDVEDDQRASHDVEDDQHASHDVEDGEDQQASHDVEGGEDQRASHDAEDDGDDRASLDAEDQGESHETEEDGRASAASGGSA